MSRAISRQLACQENFQLAEVVKIWYYLESYGTFLVEDKRCRADNLAIEQINSILKFNAKSMNMCGSEKIGSPK